MNIYGSKMTRRFITKITNFIQKKKQTGLEWSGLEWTGELVHVDATFFVDDIGLGVAEWRVSHYLGHIWPHASLVLS